MSSQPEPGPAPTREERKACWTHRDLYFSCLRSHNITIPPGTDMSDGRGPIGKAAKEEQERLERENKITAETARKQDPCRKDRDAYEQNCAKSWVEYFNKRRILEERQRMMYAQGDVNKLSSR